MSSASSKIVLGPLASRSNAPEPHAGEQRLRIDESRAQIVERAGAFSRNISRQWQTSPPSSESVGSRSADCADFANAR